MSKVHEHNIRSATIDGTVTEIVQFCRQSRLGLVKFNVSSNELKKRPPKAIVVDHSNIVDTSCYIDA